MVIRNAVEQTVMTELLPRSQIDIAVLVGRRRALSIFGDANLGGLLLMSLTYN